MAYLLFFKYKKTSIFVFILTLSGFFIIGCGILPAVLLKKLQLHSVQPQWKERNAIVLLGSGAVKLPDSHIIKPTVLAYSRIFETTRLYLSCKESGKKCNVIISGGDALATGVPEAVVYKKLLLDVGVNAADIQLETRSMNTYKNAEFTSAIIREDQVNQIILVTSGLHIKRALLYFSHFGVQAIPAPADYIAAFVSFIPSSYNFTLMDMVLHEQMGILRFHIYNYLGWNVKPVAPGSL